MQKSQSAVNTHRSALTAPSSHFTLHPVSISSTGKSKNQTTVVDDVEEAHCMHPSQGSMATLYDCFDRSGRGHFDSADTLFDRGVWIGYLAERSRNTRYRGLPSFRELEKNYKELNLPFPNPSVGISCSDREAVCRGCFGNRSIVLQLREIRFGSHNKVVILPLNGADDAGLFCIMLAQSPDRSIKPLEAFRPFEHRLEREDDAQFANSYMVLAIRDSKNNSGVLCTVRNSLDSAELTRIANRPGRLRSDSGPGEQLDIQLTVEKSSLTGVAPKIAKRKQQQTADDSSSSRNLAKRSRPVTLKGPTMSAHIVQLSDDDDVAEPLTIPGARRSIPNLKARQPAPALPNDSPQQAPIAASVPAPTPRTVNSSTPRFTNEQASRIHFVWKVEIQGMDFEVRRSLTTTSTFDGLLESFQDEAKLIPSASLQMKA
ncbi:hypothetical protein OPT61_g5498 [Boeremia exigua]|uniref:Uncharacterized protein n=1 Tax=Boeremia exigua TaxID=749465 RepID=A0ACC2IA50_9PLEO|nr:hypothetical protein OPT61_g5498 [Boeremia exigua]